MGKVAKVALPIAGLGLLGFGAAGMGPAAGLFGSTAASTAATGAAAFANPFGMSTTAALANPATAALVPMQTASSGGFFSTIGAGLKSAFSSPYMGLANAGFSAVSSLSTIGSQNALLEAQRAQIEQDRQMRSLQVLQEQRDLRQRHQKLAAIAKNNLRPGQSKRAFLSDLENDLKEGLRNIELTGRADMEVFNTNAFQAQLATSSKNFSAVSAAGRSLLTGASNFAKTRA
ncbi:MAG: hypothetical protein VW498_02020 [Candidatus Thalassarchaeaceae archaeon]